MSPRSVARATLARSVRLPRQRARVAILALGFGLVGCSPGAEPAPSLSIASATPPSSSAASIPSERTSAPSAPPSESARVAWTRPPPPKRSGPLPPPPKLPCFDEGSTAGDWLPRGTTMDAGLDGPGVDRLITEAMRSQTDSLLVVKDGVVVIERSFHGVKGPIETRSATKTIVGLAVLALVADGKIASLDLPLSTWYPEFGAPDRAGITLRHVLSHASGLHHGDDSDALDAAPDRLAYARKLRVVAPPGKNFSYSNEATQLLSGIIEGAAGRPAEDYVRERLFAPIGITDFDWARDKAGKVQMYYGLRLRARDMARIGMLLLDEGRVDGDPSRVVLPEELVREATTPGKVNPYFGLLHWLLFKGTTTRLGYLDPPKGPQIGFFAVGGLGQRFAVYPSARLVAVRLHVRRGDGKAYEDQVTWRGIFDRLEAMDPDLSSKP